MSLDERLQTVMGTLPECVAAGYVDMESGLLLGVHTLDPHPQEVLDLLAAATLDLFQGKNVAALKQMFATEGDSAAQQFNEVILLSDGYIHIFLRTARFPKHVICFTCRRGAKLGRVLTRARLAVDGISQAV